VTCDVSDEEEVAALVAHTVASFGRLDMAFNNAGIMIPPSDAADEPADNFDRVDAINLRGVWACMKHELRQMRAQARAPSSTARLSAASSGSPAALRITPPSTACSGLRRAPRSNTRRAASASTQSARARSTRRWSLA
jgi:NAD(P)-dependent dehydrogenase (short-subunit alcohol dehydrogenase family)